MKKLLSILILLIIPFIGFSQDPNDPFMRHSMLGIDDGYSAPVDAKTKLCGDIASFASTLKTFENLNTDSKIEQYRNVEKLTDQSWMGVEKSATKVPEINISEIKSGYTSIKELISSLDVQTNVVDAAPKISALVEQTLSVIEKETAASCR